MNCLTRTLTALAAPVLYATSVFAAEVPATEVTDFNQTLSQVVTEHRNNLGLVGLGAMVMQDGKVIASAVAGERKHGSGVLLTDQDKWHIGSIGKSMTATMLARLVERGELTWDTTIGDIYGDSAKVNEGWHHVTVEQLLTHTAGAVDNYIPTFTYLFRNPAEGPARMAARDGMVLKFLKREPDYPAGSRFSYANTGYLIAAAMAEKITGLPWEELVRNEVFTPLGIQSVGFGSPTGRDGRLEQPLGHKSLLGFIVSVDSDVNPLILGPAGTMHISLNDLLVYANEHLQGRSGRGKLLKAETYQHLHTPRLETYAYGWAISPHEPWANEPVIFHGGSNGHWYAMLVILPESDAVMAVVSNDERGHDDEIVWPVIAQAFRLLKSPVAEASAVQMKAGTSEVVN